MKITRENHPIYANKHLAHYELTEVLRNGNLDVLDFYTEIRNMIQNKSPKAVLMQYLLDMSKKSHEKIHFFRNRKDFLMKYIAEDRLGKDSDRIFTFTNERVDDYNQKIRDYYIKKSLGYVPEIHESDLFVVQEQGEIFNNSETIDLKSFKDVIVTIKGKKIYGYDCETSDGRKYRILKKESKEEYKKIIEMLRIYALEKKNSNVWKSFYNFSNLFLKVKYQFSNSINKSQGSSVGVSFVDCTNLDYVDADNFSRLFYVGVTRAKDEINILI